MQVSEFTYSALVDASSAKPEKNKKFEIPKFQRRRVWTPDKEDELIETLYLGNISIGALQLWKIGGAGKMEKYLLVDGLHRVSTMVKYHENPFSFGRTQEFIHEIIVSVVDKYGKTYKKEDLETCCKSWFNSKIQGNYLEFVEEKCHTEKLAELQEIVSKVADKKDKDAFVKFMQEKTRALVKNMDISKSVVPVIINTGDYNDLTILFKRINQNGTPLSLCDVLAAIWANTKISIKNKEIVENIAEHYKEMRSENNNMEIYSGEDDGKLFTVYEYMIGLKKWLCKKFSDGFYGLVKDKDFLFKLVSCCYYKDIGKKAIEKLNKTLLDANLSELEKNLVWSIEFVSEILDPVIVHENKLLITESALYIAVISLAYNNKFKIEKNKSKYSDLFLVNILNDKISETAFNAKIIKSVVADSKYLYRVHKDAFSEKFLDYLGDNAKLYGTNDKVSAVTKLVLSIINNINSDDEANEDIKMIFANVIPKKIIADFNKENKLKLSINCTGNTCMHPSTENKRKPSESVSKFLSGEGVADDDISNNILLLNNSSKFDDILENKDDFSKKEYQKFLEFRSIQIKTKIMNYFNESFKNKDEEDKIENDQDLENSDDESEAGSESCSESGDSDSKSGSNSDNESESNSSDSDSEEEKDVETKPQKIQKKKVGGRTSVKIG